jgi:hypothetical protein
LTDRIGSQVDVTLLVNVWSRLTRVAITLSSASRMLIARSQRAWISLSLCVLSCITLSHRRTQMRWIDSAIRIWRRREAPQLVLFCGVWFTLWICSGSAGRGRWMDPHPSATPMLGIGHFSGAWGHSLFARSHIVLTGHSWQCISMCSMVSVVLQRRQACRSSYPGMWFQ